MNQIEIENGKYTIINELQSGGRLTALRHGGEWRDLTGDDLILAMYHEIERLRKENDELYDEHQTYVEREWGDDW